MLPRETSKYWRMLFRAIGVDFELQPPAKNTSGKSGTIRIKNLPARPNYNKRFSEGGLPNSLTSTIKTFDSDNRRVVDESGKLATIINGNINKVEGHQTISFETRLLFDRESTASLRRLKLLR